MPDYLYSNKKIEDKKDIVGLNASASYSVICTIGFNSLKPYVFFKHFIIRPNCRFCA